VGLATLFEHRFHFISKLRCERIHIIPHFPTVPLTDERLTINRKWIMAQRLGEIKKIVVYQEVVHQPVVFHHNAVSLLFLLFRRFLLG
jgi:hypothetical protein